MKTGIKINARDKELIAEFLKRISLFKHFSDRNLRCVVEDFKTLEVKKGDDIVFQADQGTDLYIVLKGKVKVSFVDRGGNELVLTNLGEGDFFGEMSLIDNKSRSANVVAEEDTQLGVLRREMFICTMKQNTDIAFDLLISLVERLRKADDMIQALAFLDVHERLLKYMSEIAKKEGGPDANGCYRIKKMRHHEIASNIGASREAVTKALKVLCLNNKILEKDGCYFITPEVPDEF